MFRQRLRVFFTKEGPLRFISHHDLMRLFERALRRADLPLKMSEGFNPRPQLSFPAALALGVESRGEVFEVELTEWVSPSRVKAGLEREAPEGIGILSVESVRYAHKAEVIGAEFTVRMARTLADFADRLADFLNSREAMVARKTKSGVKSVNVREYVRYARLDADTLTVCLSVTPAGSARPEEVLDAIAPGSSRTAAPLAIVRTRLDTAPAASRGANVEKDVG